MQQCDFSSNAFGRRRLECPSSSNLAEQEETCLPLPRDNPHREQASVGSGMNIYSHLPLPAWTKGIRGQWEGSIPYNGLLPVWD